MLKLNVASLFIKDRRRCIKRGYDMARLNDVVNTLLVPASLSANKKDHPLSGKWVNYRECHIQPDWLLIYRIDGKDLYLARTGTHADLFGI